MGIRKWFSRSVETGKSIQVDPASSLLHDALHDVHIRELAFWACVNMIARAVNRCEFRTFLGGKEVKEKEYYLWNVAPNKNQSADAFVQKLIAKLYRENEVLVVQQEDQLLIADSFTRQPYVLFDDLFQNVSIGSFTFQRRFEQSEVLYFQLSEQSMQPILRGIYQTHQRLIEYTIASYRRNRGMRGILKVRGHVQGSPQFEKIVEELMNNKFSNYFKGDSAVVPLEDGYEYEQIRTDQTGIEDTRDIRALLDDVVELTATAFGIPSVLLSGQVAGIDAALEHFLTFVVAPLCDLLETEINRKRNGLAGFRRGDAVEIDTSSIKHVDLLNEATSVDKLIASGAYSINEIRRLTGSQRIDEDWADEHFLTKNYEQIEPMKGGRKDEQNMGD